MDRKGFLKSCGYACVSGVALATLFQGCGSSKTVNGILKESHLIVDLADFIQVKKGKNSYRKYLIVQNKAMNFPICLYRNGEKDYKALHLSCTHQGVELQVFGEQLVCPAHGSEFNKEGKVVTGPAFTDLRSFPVQVQENKIQITLS
mgnify:CR=1 FL=1